MAMKRCPQGHYYDPAKHTSCPVCGVNGLEIGVTSPRRGLERMGDPGPRQDSGETRTLAKDPLPGAPPVLLKSNGSGETRKRGEPPQPPQPPQPSQPGDISPHEAMTQRVIFKDLKINPVVGWLVCVAGQERGRDYRIRSEKNAIGRSESMDICITGDDSISRERHAVISYNPKANSFRVMPGDGPGLVFLNDAEVSQPMDLAAYDVIELGKTRLLFVPLCNDRFQWTTQGE